ncbi:hypothetical protein K469DRAFT_300743 [Zopfia rhizophila CBS 207.26]|uniref:Uncharacterized protein n=1 Tax=Zopfia rhizophila CBS 207.26 TaxID=1314779 RepID=A0A6A6DMQ2_9PEZI|nr:hypothetical protein K469DRAFT_300743 [Zopfia rhizophila CBS 207.26]
MSDPKDYTVGWICAITTEYVAAQEFLDEEHDGPEYVSPNDNNNYKLGKVGKHNIVIAVLPDGEYGKSCVASVARDMLHSFPNVRIGLMVGIGGGVPRKHDIRLGDIVVSSTGDGKGGVFQYDFGKAIQGLDFQETGFLNQPPPLLRATVGGLKAHYERKGHQLEEAINSILEKNPRLQKKYKRPEPGSDRLFKAEVTHDTSCAAVCSNDPLNLILRPKRAEDEDNLAIHYGLIASADRLMKDALVRDRLAEEKDVLCFEMEAAGLMNHFPCLVIRGICDYSDSHKNKEWQGYAAMAAVAYAKDLLCQIPPNRVEAEKKIVDVLSGVQDGLNKLLNSQRNRDHNVILEWLTPVDYGPQQSDYIRRRQAGTGQWLLDSKEFNEWLDQSKQTLFCPGMPGAGKTIVTSIVVQYLCDKFRSDPTVGIAYLYCNFRQQHDQNDTDLLLSLLKQLVQEQPSIPESVKNLYTYHKGKRTRPSLSEVLKALHSVAAYYSRAFIIVDALDECRVSDGSRGRFLSEIFNLQVKTRANIFATSRYIPEIGKEFEGSILVEIRASGNDVRKYLEGHILQLPSFVLCSPDLQEKIKTEIIKAVDGMFLLAQLHLDSLMDKTSKKEITCALGKLPKGSEALDYAYKEALQRIEFQKRGHRDLAKRILLWITCARRPLNTLELRHALAVEVGELALDSDNLRDTEVMLSVCAGLVTIDEKSDIIRLVHYTTQEYFERTWTSWFPDAQDDITITCVTYLSFDTFESGFCLTDEEFEARLRSNALYDYAARNWGYHAHATKEEMVQSVLRLLESKAKVSAASQAMMASRDFSGYSQRVPKRLTGVHLAAYFGLRDTLMTILKNGRGIDINSKDGGDEYDGGRTALSYAAERGHEAVVKLLLAKDGVDINSKAGYRGRTALSYAAKEGHGAVVKLLLAKDGVDINSKDGVDYGIGRRTALSYAAEEGHEAVVKLLLAKDGVDINGSGSRTALSYAAERGHEAVVKLLLAKDGVDINGSGQAAAREGWRRH